LKAVLRIYSLVSNVTSLVACFLLLILEIALWDGAVAHPAMPVLFRTFADASIVTTICGVLGIVWLERCRSSQTFERRPKRPAVGVGMIQRYGIADCLVSSCFYGASSLWGTALLRGTDSAVGWLCRTGMLALFLGYLALSGYVEFQKQMAVRRLNARLRRDGR